MIYEINHVGVRTRDMARTLAYYAAFDSQIVFDEMIPGPQIRIVYLQLGGGLIEFISLPAHADVGGGPDHLAFLTDHIDADHARLLAAGAIEATAPRPAGTGVGRISFLTLGDARLELLERDVELRRPVLEHSIVRDLDHYALAAPDLAAAGAFFTGVLGLVPLSGIDAEVRRVRRFLGLKSDVLGIVAPGTETVPGVFPYIALRVADVDAALTELARRGLTGVDRTEVSRAAAGRRALVEAPDGVRLELLDRSGR